LAGLPGFGGKSGKSGVNSKGKTEKDDFDPMKVEKKVQKEEVIVDKEKEK